jgi:hypothetical protein
MVLIVILGVVGVLFQLMARSWYPVVYFTQSVAGGWFHKLMEEADGDKVWMHISCVSVSWACLGAAAMRLVDLY